MSVAGADPSYAAKEGQGSHLNVIRMLVVEGEWVHRRMYDMTWSDEEKCRGCNKEEGTEKHRLYHCPSWQGSQTPDPRRT